MHKKLSGALIFCGCVISACAGLQTEHATEPAPVVTAEVTEVVNDVPQEQPAPEIIPPETSIIVDLTEAMTYEVPPPKPVAARPVVRYVPQQRSCSGPGCGTGPVRRLFGRR